MKPGWFYTAVSIFIFLASQTVSAALVLHLEFEGDFSDSSGLGNDAAVDSRSVGSVTTVSGGVDGGALSIQGLGWLSVLDSPSLSPTTALTMSAWVNPNGKIGNNAGVFFKGELVGVQPDWQIVINDVGTGGLSGPSGAVTSVNGTGGATSAALVVDYTVKNPIPDGEWTHIASTYDGNILKLFVDGILVGTDDFVSSLNTSGSPLYIGNRFLPAGDTGGYQGLMDELRIYDTALSDAEIRSLANLAPVPIPPTAWLLASALGLFGYLGNRKANA